MIFVDAASDPAFVVELKTRRNWAFLPLIVLDMSRSHFSFDRNVAVAAAGGSQPDQTPGVWLRDCSIF
jgi:hypothetical protein